MSRTFEDRRREKQEKEQRKQVRQERLDAARREALEEDRRRQRDAALRAQTRLHLTAQVQREVLALANAAQRKEESRKQGLADLRQARTAARRDEAMQSQREKQARKALLEETKLTASAVSAPPPTPGRPEPRKANRKEAAKATAAEQIRVQRQEEVQAAQEQQRRQRSQQEARRLARKELLAEQTRRAAVPKPDASEDARRARQAQARAARLREERSRTAAKDLRNDARNEQRRAQRKQEAAEARKIAQRSAVEPIREESPPPPRTPATKVADRRLARKRAVAAAVTQSPPPEEPHDSLPWLKTRGSFLVDELLNAVYLRGVTCRGFDDVSASDRRTFPEALSLDDPNLSTMSGLWGINVVRIPFQAATVLSGNSSFAADQMLAGLDDIVGAVTTAGARVLLSMEAPSGDGPGTTPDSDTFRAWSFLANHYQDEPGVLYELFSSPQPLPDNWLDVAAMLVGTIRLQNPASLIFVGNGRRGADISGLPLRFSTGDPVFNVAYTIDVSDTLAPDPDDAYLRAFAVSYPLFASPWSEAALNADRSSDSTSNLFSRYGMGWIAANWNADPPLVRSSIDHDFAPTRWGYVAQRALALPVKPLLPDARLEDQTASAWRLA